MSHDAAPSSCLNCDTRLHGKFCHACGQKATSASVNLHDFVHVYGGSLGRTLAKGVAAGVLYWIIAISSVLGLTFAILINL